MKLTLLLCSIACVAAFGAIVACSPRQDAPVHMAAVDNPAEGELRQRSNGLPLPRDGECLPRFVEVPTAPDDCFVPSEETDEAVLARLAGYADWHLVNPLRFIQRDEVSKRCISWPENWQRCNEQTSHALTPMIDSGEVEWNVFPSRAGIHVFVNPPAEVPMLTQKQPHFPEGSIIVKQKWHDAEQEVPDLLTVMIKREAGYNPEVGDWEFLAVSGDAQRIDARGRLDNCQACHIPRANTDFVIRSYLPREILAGLE